LEIGNWLLTKGNHNDIISLVVGNWKLEISDTSSTKEVLMIIVWIVGALLSLFYAFRREGLARFIMCLAFVWCFVQFVLLVTHH
jgi:hypothetical protein